MMKKIGVIVGSLRKESFNRKIAKNVLGMFPEGYEAEIIEIGELVHYNEDLDQEGMVPQAWQDFREKIAPLSAVVFVTPEYNRGLPSVIKNALDVGSRPYGASVWDGKPALVISASIGGPGGFGANHQLRQSLVFLNMTPLQQPEAYLGNVQDFLDEEGLIVNQGTYDYIQSIVDAFVNLIEKLS
ncbi:MULTISPECIES: NAD(P)H-dependent oxidoreductase [Vagococcus]|uniref:NADPH-dependent FMN reductase n=1 Tax=Vagococcus TaxID=2737 RepID=UPI00257AEFAB|nr:MULTISPECIES: NAD(P)H-dependent oxidoreductase [Vagococcus]MDT2807540.1 NAD(P)H-dependent oxidoreductase [Vagococcus lutrae]